MATEFMMTLHRELTETKKVAESTADAYLKTLTILNDKKPFKNLTFLKKTEDILTRVAEYADSTQRAVLATIVSVLSLHTETPAKKRLHELYREKMMGKVEETKKADEGKEGQKTKKQTENWVSWDEVKSKKEELAKEVDASRSKKTLLVGDYEHLLSLVVLSLYTDIQPRRNQDYTEMMVVKQWKTDMPTTHNYYDIKGKRFVFNKFKTAKTYGQQIVELPPSLLATLTYYIKRHPLAKEVKTDYPLLVDAHGTPLTAVNAITRILNKLFGGKKVGSSMLRHIFITEKYGGAKTEMERDATAMAHSVAEQQKVYNVPKEASMESVSIPTI